MRAAGRLLDLPYDSIKAFNISVEQPFYAGNPVYIKGQEQYQYEPGFFSMLLAGLILMVTVPVKFIVGIITYPLRCLSNYLYKKADIDESRCKNFNSSLIERILEDLHSKREKCNHSFSVATTSSHAQIKEIDCAINVILNSGSFLCAVQFCENKQLKEAIFSYLYSNDQALISERKSMQNTCDFLSMIHKHFGSENLHRIITRISNPEIFSKIILNSDDLLHLIEERNTSRLILNINYSLSQKDHRKFCKVFFENIIVATILHNGELFEHYLNDAVRQCLKNSLKGDLKIIIQVIDDIFHATTKNKQTVLDKCYQEVEQIRFSQYFSDFVKSISFVLPFISNASIKKSIEQFQKRLFAPPSLQNLCLSFVQKYFNQIDKGKDLIKSKLPVELSEKIFENRLKNG